MQESIIRPGEFLPDNQAEFDQLKAEGKLWNLKCNDCDCTFSRLNVHTYQGWRETQISGMCEDCYDNLFQE